MYAKKIQQGKNNFLNEMTHAHSRCFFPIKHFENGMNAPK
jgi:hypothetical protein